MPYNSYFDLYGKQPENTFQNLVQVDTSSNDTFYDGRGNSFVVYSALSSISASWASQSLSSSYAPTVLVTGSIYNITSSYSTTASYTIITQLTQSNSSSSFAVSASWASASYTSSFLTPGTYSITSSWANNARNAITTSVIPAFLATNNAGMNIVGHINGNNAILQSNALVDATGNITASSFTGSFTGSNFGTSSWAINVVNTGTTFKSGIVPGSSFGIDMGGSQNLYLTSAVSFGTPYANNSYNVVFSFDVGSQTTLDGTTFIILVAYAGNKTANGFTIFTNISGGFSPGNSNGGGDISNWNCNWHASLPSS